LTIGWNLSLSVGQFLQERRNPGDGHNRRLSRLRAGCAELC
jgi:hypothetical protein